MLVLSRKLNDTICIGDDIVVKVVKIRGTVVGLGIVAPDDVKVMRRELLERDRQRDASEPSRSPSKRPALNVVRSVADYVRELGKPVVDDSAREIGRVPVAESSYNFRMFQEESSKTPTHTATI